MRFEKSIFGKNKIAVESITGGEPVGSFSACIRDFPLRAPLRIAVAPSPALLHTSH